MELKVIELVKSQDASAASLRSALQEGAAETAAVKAAHESAATELSAITAARATEAVLAAQEKAASAVREADLQCKIQSGAALLSSALARADDAAASRDATTIMLNERNEDYAALSREHANLQREYSTVLEKHMVRKATLSSDSPALPDHTNHVAATSRIHTTPIFSVFLRAY